MTRRSTVLAGWAAVGLALCANGAQAAQAPVRALRITNMTPGETLRYPVALLRGEADAADGAELRVVNESSTRDTRELKTTVLGRRFKALAELVPGENRLTLALGERKLPFRITYRPQTNPYYVRMIYLTDNSGDTAYQSERPGDRQEYAAKLDTAAKLMQTFTAERLHDQGYGRRTFNLEFDRNGKVVVHTVKAPQTTVYYHGRTGNQLWSEFYGFLDRTMPDPKAKNCVVMAFTRFDPVTRQPKAHTALGGGNLGLFGSAGMFAWPARLQDVQAAFSDTTRVNPAITHDDSAGRSNYWGLASTTLGAVLHEMGHTFGLPHSQDPMDIMTRGFDHLNRAFTLIEPPHARRPTPFAFGENEVAWWGRVSAPRLVYSRHFQPDARNYQDQPAPSGRLETATGKLVITAPLGARVLAINGNGNYSRDNDVFPNEPPKRLEYDLADLTRRAGGGSLAVQIIDAEGNTAAVEGAQLANPAHYLRAWRISERPVPWPRTDAFLPVDARRVMDLTTELQARPLETSPSAMIDLWRRFPGQTDNRVADALTTVESDREQPVTLLTGSDDALRVWLNGALVVSKLELRGASPDSDRTKITLRNGMNVLLVEVSNGGGGWGFLARLEDASGAKLVPDANGRLAVVK